MELDPRILEGKKALDCFDVEIAKQFEGKKGYFSHYIDNYADLKNTVLGTLVSTGDTFHESYCCTEGTFDNYYYEFFLPAEWVKEPEKKYRPFTDLEFINKFEFQLGYAMRVRDKKSEYARTQYEYKTVFTGYRQCIGGIEVFLNGKWYTMGTLFDSFEYMENDEWRPFGVEE